MDKAEELDDELYDVFVTLVDVYGSADRVTELLVGIRRAPQGQLDLARRRLEHEDAEIERREDG